MVDKIRTIRFRVSDKEWESLSRTAQLEETRLRTELQKRGLAGVELGVHGWARLVVLEAARKKGLG